MGRLFAIAGVLLFSFLAFFRRKSSFGYYDDSPAISYPIAFPPAAFASPDVPGSGRFMAQGVVTLVGDIHKAIPVRVSSAYRTASHNAKVGGVPDSAHLKGLAVDLIPLSHTPRELADYVKSMGIARVGTYSSRGFCHVDIDLSKSYQGSWVS